MPEESRCWHDRRQRSKFLPYKPDTPAISLPFPVSSTCIDNAVQAASPASLLYERCPQCVNAGTSSDAAQNALRVAHDANH
jgi:hypothetical protein